MKKFAYRYEDAGGDPLRYCPACKARLTDEDAILVHLVRGNGVTRWTERTRLDEAGNLIDLGSVAQGYHSHSACRGCLATLIEMDGVVEVRLVPEKPRPRKAMEVLKGRFPYADVDFLVIRALTDFLDAQAVRAPGIIARLETFIFAWDDPEAARADEEKWSQGKRLAPDIFADPEDD